MMPDSKLQMAALNLTLNPSKKPDAKNGILKNQPTKTMQEKNMMSRLKILLV